MSQGDEYDYEERAPSPLDRKSALDRSQQLPPSVKNTQGKSARGDTVVSMDMSLDVPAHMDVDEEEEDFPPPRLVQQKQLSRAPSPVFEVDVKRARTSSSQPQTKSKVKPKPQPASTRATRNTRSSKVQEPELTSEDSMPSDSSPPPPPRKAGPVPKKKR